MDLRAGRSHAGRRPWVVAWHEGLYGERGFYRGAAGPAGHFATSCHGRAGVLLADALRTLAARHGCSQIIDIGAGRGELLTALAAGEAPLALTGVDIVARPSGLAENIDWIRSPGGPHLPSLGPLEDALVFANEWLDVIPVPVGEVDARGVLREVEVDAEGAEHLGASAGETATFDEQDLAWAMTWWPAGDAPGTRVEVGRPRDIALRALIDAIGSGVIVAADYGHRREARPGAGTLVGYRGGQLTAPLPDGSTDLTAHVAMDSLPHDRLRTQREALLDLGFDGTGVLAGRGTSYDLARRDPQRYLAALQHNSARAQLLNAPLGDFTWAITEIPPRSARTEGHALESAEDKGRPTHHVDQLDGRIALQQ
jgi:hypothetical protein